MPNQTYTNRQLKALESRIKGEYTQAYNQCKDEMQKIMAKINATPNMSTQQKIALMNKYDRLDNMSKQMTDTIYNAGQVARRYIDGSNVNVFRNAYNLNAEELGFSLIDNTTAKQLLNNQVNPFEKIDALHDKTAIKNKMTSQMISGILQGDSISQMARRLKSVSEGYLSNAIRIARTETTRVENAGHYEVGKQGEKMGFNMWKRWIATADPRTRDSHLEADMQEVPLNEPFIVDGEKLMYPGDPAGSPENVINCRCVMVSFIKTDKVKSTEWSNEKIEKEKERRRNPKS